MQPDRGGSFCSVMLDLLYVFALSCPSRCILTTVSQPFLLLEPMEESLIMYDSIDSKSNIQHMNPPKNEKTPPQNYHNCEMGRWLFGNKKSINNLPFVHLFYGTLWRMDECACAEHASTSGSSPLITNCSRTVTEVVILREWIQLLFENHLKSRNEARMYSDLDIIL